MKCPVCRGHEQTETNLHAEGFYENIVECSACGSTWSINHGMAEVVKDTQEKSFLEAISECVEGDDYGVAAAL